MHNERNEFEDLGFSREESAALAIRGELYSQIVRAARWYSQAELQRLLHESRPRIIDLMTGNGIKFSFETLLVFAYALGLQPEISTHEPRLKPVLVRSAAVGQK